MHIGSGERGEAVDNPLLRISINGKETPYIPGSSLKGVFRAFIESITDENERKDVVEYLFGSQEVAAHILISDAYPVNYVEEVLVTHIKPSVAIDRVTGAARRGALFRVETVPPQTRFNFRMIVENLDFEKRDSKESNSLIWLLQELIRGNIYVGGKTSSGFGRIALENLIVQKLTKDSVRNGQFEYKPVALGLEDV